MGRQIGNWEHAAYLSVHLVKKGSLPKHFEYVVFQHGVRCYPKSCWKGVLIDSFPFITNKRTAHLGAGAPLVLSQVESNQLDRRVIPCHDLVVYLPNKLKTQIPGEKVSHLLEVIVND